MARVGIALRGETYAAEVAMRTHGLVSALVDWSFASGSHGRVGEGALRPATHAFTSRWREKRRSVRLVYRSGAGPRTEAEPPYAPEVEERVPEHLRAGTVDLLSGLLGTLDALARNGSCEHRFPVFDGRRRYDVVQKTRGRERLAPNPQSSFVGEATACRFERLPVAGFRKGAQADTGDHEPDLTGTIWYARLLPGALPAPVRVEVGTGFGTIYVHLAGACAGPPPEGAPPVPAKALAAASACAGQFRQAKRSD